MGPEVIVVGSPGVVSVPSVTLEALTVAPLR